MWKIITRPSVLCGFCGILLAALGIVVALTPLLHGEQLTPIRQFEAILVFVLFYLVCFVTIIFLQVEFFHEIKKSEGRVMAAARDHDQRIIDAVITYPILQNTPWCNSGLKKLAKLVDEGSQIHKAEVQLAFDRFLVKISGIVHSVHSVSYNESQESDRMRRLKDIVQNADNYVYAVTLDKGEYIADFWQGQYSDEYVNVNVGAGKKVRRIFVLNRKMNKNIKSIVDDVIRKHTAAKLEFKIIYIDKLPLRLQSHDTSFLVCDGHIASESYTLSNPASAAGYVCLNDAKAAERLRHLFEEFNAVPSEDWTFLT